MHNRISLKKILIYLQGSIEEWLGALKLEEYHAKLRAQGYHTVRQVRKDTEIYVLCEILLRFLTLTYWRHSQRNHKQQLTL